MGANSSNFFGLSLDPEINARKLDGLMYAYIFGDKLKATDECIAKGLLVVDEAGVLRIPKLANAAKQAKNVGKPYGKKLKKKGGKKE
jgi:hypothetical protein